MKLLALGLEQIFLAGLGGKGIEEHQKGKRMLGHVIEGEFIPTGTQCPLGNAVHCRHLGALWELSQCPKTIWSPFKISPYTACLEECVRCLSLWHES